MVSNFPPEPQRPLSPNIQLYRPQLTSVLSILNRLTGVLLSIAAIALVIWLLAAATGPQAYAIVQAALASWTGRSYCSDAHSPFFCISSVASDTLSGTPYRDLNFGRSICRDGPSGRQHCDDGCCLDCQRLHRKITRWNAMTCAPPLAALSDLGLQRTGSATGGCNASRRSQLSRSRCGSSPRPAKTGAD